MTYNSINYPKPDELENKYPRSKVLIIGSGPSTQNIIRFKDKIKDKFDLVIVLNYID